MDENNRPVVLQVLPALRPGGAERGAIEVTRALAKAGWKPLVASAGGPFVPSVAYAGGTHIQLPLNSKNPLRIWRNIRLIEKLIKEHKVDIVHARSRAPAWSAFFACKRTGAHFITTFH